MDWRENFRGGSEFDELLRELIADGRIEGAMLGMAMKVLRGGVDSLTAPQAFVFGEQLVEPYTRFCPRHGGQIPYDEVVCAIMFNDGYCSYCAEKTVNNHDEISPPNR